MTTMAHPRTLWPWGIVLGLALGVTVLLSMATIAFRHRSAIVPGDPDRDGLEFDRVLVDRRAAAELGWRVELDPCAALVDGACVLALRVRDRDGIALAGVEGELVATRGDDARWDRSASIEPTASGYRSALPLGRGGLYRISLRLVRGDDVWIGERELLLVGE